MVRVLLIDVDSVIPNLALMKVSSFFKRERGNTVGFGITDPDKVYASVIFNRDRHKVDGLPFYYSGAEINIGGSGYDLNSELPPEIEECYPDYSIYPKCDRYYGFTSRGCIRNCYFCVVPKKEGKFHTLDRSPREALERIIGTPIDAPTLRFSQIEFLDNNILADKEHFIGLVDAIKELERNAGQTIPIDFNQGLDARLLDNDMAEALHNLTPITKWKFAFDQMQYKDKVLESIQILNDAHINTRNTVMYYVYCHDDAHVPDALERANILREHNTGAFVMLNQDTKRTQRMTDLKRWCIPQIFWTVTFDDYRKSTRKE